MTSRPSRRLGLIADAQQPDRTAVESSPARASPTPPTIRGGPMPYIEGFVAAVPTANREAYIEHAKEGAEYFKNLGATRATECWGDDVPRGEVTNFFRATR